MKNRKLLTPPKSILICRTDKLGDFVLSLPSFVFIKKALPNTKIIALTQEYTKPIAELCDSIDEIITIPHSTSAISTINTISATLKPYAFDVSICLFTTATLAISLLKSKIPVRVAPATKIDQLFHNFCVRQRRSLSLKSEFNYNLDLIKFYLNLTKSESSDVFERPLLNIKKTLLNNTKEKFQNTFNINKSQQLIFIHVGSGGSANNLSPEKYAELITLLSTKISATFILCEGPEDTINVNKTIKQLKNIHIIRYISDKGLTEFIQHIAIADLFISGSTGPLHIAGALNIPTVGFYPNRRSATSTRWKTLNTDDKLLAFSPDNTINDIMDEIDLNLVIKSILSSYLTLL